MNLAAPGRFSLRAVALGLVSAVLVLISTFAGLLAFAALFVSCSPEPDEGKVALVQIGVACCAAAVFAYSLARRLWSLREPGTSNPSRASSSMIRELLGISALVGFGAGVTALLTRWPPWSTTPIHFYGPYDSAVVVPLSVFLRVLAPLLSIRLLPRLATLAFARRWDPSRIAVLASLGAVAVVLLSFKEWQLPIDSPYLLVVLVLDLALAVVLGIVAIESFDRARSTTPERSA